MKLVIEVECEVDEISRDFSTYVPLTSLDPFKDGLKNEVMKKNPRRPRKPRLPRPHPKCRTSFPLQTLFNCSP